MIQLQIIIKDPHQINEIGDLLINKELVLDVTQMNTQSRFKNERNEIETVLTKLLMCRTKALLFTTIERLLLEKYGDRMPELYALPITNMNIAQMQRMNNKVLVKMNNNSSQLF